VGVALALTVAVTSDLQGEQNPTHTVVLVLVAAAAALVWLRLSGSTGLGGSVAGVLVLQPVLHEVGELVGAGQALDGAGVLHVVVSDGPAAGIQFALSTAIAVAAAVLAQCSGLLGSALDPARLLVAPPPEPADERPTVQPRTAPRRSRRQGRRGRAALDSRRGPPHRHQL